MISASLPRNCSPISFSIAGDIHVEQRRQHAEIDDVLEQLPLPRVVVGAVADLGQRRADHVDVVAEPRGRHRPCRIVKQIAAGLDLGDVLVPGLRVHRDHHVDAAAPAEIAVLADPHLEPGRQTLDVRRKDVARTRRDAHPQHRLGEQRVGAGRAGAVDVGEFDDEVVDAGYRLRHAGPACVMSIEELAHVPCAGRTALGAQAAMQADILVLDHDAPGLQRVADIKVLLEIGCRRAEPGAQLCFLAVLGEGDAVHRADIDAGVALDAQLAGEYRLNVAIQAALGFEIGELVVIAEFDLGPDVVQRDRQIAQRHPVALVVRDVVVVAPLVDAHFLADQRHARGRPAR